MTELCKGRELAGCSAGSRLFSFIRRNEIAPYEGAGQAGVSGGVPGRPRDRSHG